MSRIPLLPGRKRPLLFAHRGCSSLAPENTLASFRKAREAGAPGLELDIHLCMTGELVVAHDDTFLRTAPAGANGEGKGIEELSLGEIQAIDVGSFFGPGFSGEHPPLLAEVLEEFCPDLYVDIELKSRRTKGDPLPAAAAALLKSMGKKIEESVTVSSFNPLCLRAFKRAAPPHIPTAAIYCVNPEVPPALRRGAGRFIAGCDYAKPEYAQATAFARFRIAGLEGRPLVPWTVDDPALAERLLALGCEGIITNRPQDMGVLAAFRS
ncbi:MAG: glycerophosphodiester phosphodiesterase [Treponema sp.]|jgi:glycerophosphoryl diester phosphodiesterase|nr:glycerophosphodiester phosphodiesterase [Treponema sp.]